MQGRLEFTMLNLVGQTVTVSLCDGSCYEGVFASKDDDVGLGLALLQARLVPTEHDTDLSRNAHVHKCLAVKAEDVVLIEAAKVPFSTEGPTGGHVSHRTPGMPTDLRPWSEMGAGAGMGGDDDDLDAAGHQEGSWDQFQANKKLGVTTSYREDIYTTQLDRTKMSKEQQARAAELERQINQRESRGAQHDIERGKEFEGDEGEAFSNVARPAGAPAPAPAKPKAPASAPPAKHPLPTAASLPRHWHKQPNSLARAFATAVSIRGRHALTAPPAWPHSVSAPCVEEDGGDFTEAQFRSLCQPPPEPPVRVTVGMPALAPGAADSFNQGRGRPDEHSQSQNQGGQQNHQAPHQAQHQQQGPPPQQHYQGQPQQPRGGGNRGDRRDNKGGRGGRRDDASLASNDAMPFQPSGAAGMPPALPTFTNNTIVPNPNLQMQGNNMQLPPAVSMPGQMPQYGGHGQGMPPPSPMQAGPQGHPQMHRKDQHGPQGGMDQGHMPPHMQHQHQHYGQPPQMQQRMPQHHQNQGYGQGDGGDGYHQQMPHHGQQHYHQQYQDGGDDGMDMRRRNNMDDYDQNGGGRGGRMPRRGGGGGRR